MKHYIIQLVLLALLLGVNYPALAGSDYTITHQGFVSTESGDPVEDGVYSFTFRLYDDESEGDLLWSESQDLEVQGGVFSAQLGSEESFDLEFDTAYWISVEINGEDELEPRMPLSATPYAMHALSIEDGAVSGAKIDEDAIQSGENITIERDDNQNLLISSEIPEDLEIEGELSFGDGSAQRTAGPIAKGFVNADGELGENVNISSVSIDDPGRYRITIEDESFWFDEYAVSITPISSNTPAVRYTSNAGDLIVEIEDGEETAFSIVVHSLMD